MHRLAAVLTGWLGTRQIAAHPGRRDIASFWFRPKAGVAGVRIEPGHELKAWDLPKSS